MWYMWIFLVLNFRGWLKTTKIKHLKIVYTTHNGGVASTNLEIFIPRKYPRIQYMIKP